MLGAVAAVSLLMPSTQAVAAGGGIVNGDFETDPVGSSTVTGWTFHDDLVDLGVTDLGGCTSQDTSDYTDLRDWTANADSVLNLPVPVGAGGELLVPGTTDPVWLDRFGDRTAANAVGARQVFHGTAVDYWGDTITDFYVHEGPDVVAVADLGYFTNTWDFATGFDRNVLPLLSTRPDPVLRADDLPPATDSAYWDHDFVGPPTFASATVDAGSAADVALAPASTALELRSDMYGGAAEATGYVAHGPAVISDPFSTAGNRTVLLDWAASGTEDDYHVLGYVLNADTCQQIEVLDATGESSAWQTTSVSLPTAGTYRFVFVAGTYDASWAQAAGAILYVDDIRVLPSTPGTSIDVEPLFDVGAPAAGAPVQLTGDELLPNAHWSARLHPGQVTLAAGTTDAHGNFWRLGDLPAILASGAHTVVLSGTAPDGAPRTDTLWITVSPSGTVSYVSAVGPEVVGGAGGGGGDPAPTTDGDGAASGHGGAAYAGTGQLGGIPDHRPASTGVSRPAGDGGPSTLATTGFDAVPWTGLGLGLVAAGCLTAWGARRRVRRS